ncbi:MAG: short-chain dehydrogenase [Deltaproteobacteria bacterium]|nr:short-chain dehydrogenase [Deltaproteobacteria bacterium]MBU51145.1 short-chain dehydrogenase [Deltaproteobacteria bacterium]|tara:strand:+ start:2070 stop:3533 length:1464 start_codon:yes stop_codon:yes gene_type:complete
MAKKPRRPLQEREIVHCLKTLQQFAQDIEGYETHPRFQVILQAAMRLQSTYERHQEKVPPQEEPEQTDEPERLPGNAVIGLRLASRKRCYCCKQFMLERHPSYAAMCVSCGEVNRERRSQQVDLRGRIAIVTGARIKIGYATTLRLLRAGAHVIATTRFPKSAAETYAREADFHTWRDRLEIHALDLRSFPAIRGFVEDIKRQHTHIDILINNAAQTIRRPTPYYNPILHNESQPFESEDAYQLLSDVCKALYQKHTHSSRQLTENTTSQLSSELLPLSDDITQRQYAPVLSSLPILAEDFQEDPHSFPQNELNMYGQPADNRAYTSWEQEIEDVEDFELLEVHMINAMAPFLLMKHLRPLMLNSPFEKRFIVNVTSIEGQFVTSKKPTKGAKHPHTNMTKSALNMLTFSGAHADTKLGLYRVGVDPGWASIENGMITREKWIELGVEAPLDFDDAATRITDPIYQSLLFDVSIHGKLFKDFQVVPW